MNTHTVVYFTQSHTHGPAAPNTHYSTKRGLNLLLKIVPNKCTISSCLFDKIENELMRQRRKLPYFLSLVWFKLQNHRVTSHTLHIMQLESAFCLVNGYTFQTQHPFFVTQAFCQNGSLKPSQDNIRYFSQVAF